MSDRLPIGKSIAALLVAAACLGACDKDKVEQRRLTRGGDQPAVVIVEHTSDRKDAVAEVEPNGEVGEAQALIVDTPMRGVLDGSDDMDRYVLMAPSSGLLFVEVSGGGAADLTITIADSQGNVIAKSDRGPAGTAEGFPGFGVEAGSTHQLVVAEFVGRKLRKAGGRTGPSSPYLLVWSVEEDAKEGFEREPNADLAGASEILAGEERHGYVGWSGDVDLWRMPISNSGEVTAPGAERQTMGREALHVVVSAAPGVATTLALLSPEGEILVERRGGKGHEVALRNFVPAVGADAYSIRVGGKPSNPRESYTLRVDTAQLAPGTEEEPNDVLEQATPIGGDGSTLLIARGEVTLGDVDIFRLTPVSHDRILDLRLAGPSDADLDISVIAESGAVIIEALGEGVGQRETLTQVPVGAGAAPLLRVVPKSVKDPAEYELSLSLVRGTAPPIAPAVPADAGVPNIPSPSE